MSSYISVMCLLVLLLAGSTGCENSFKKKTNWRVSLGRNDKAPYGAYLAYASLPKFFPGSQVTDLSPGFRYHNIDDPMMMQDQPALLVAAGLDFYVTEAELDKLVEFADGGNEVVIFARSIDRKLQHYLQCKMTMNTDEEMPLTQFDRGTSNRNLLTLATDKTHRYGYEGRSLKAKFLYPLDTTSHHANVDSTSLESLTTTEEIVTDLEPLTTTADILGYCDEVPNMLRFNIGDGHITLHSAPLSLSNYFLLQDGNLDYLAGVWNTLPSNIGHIYWNSYYKRNSRTADLGVLLAFPATRWAFILALFTLAMYLVFESKRKQRIIAEIPPLENTSATFAETVGRLYYNKGDHNNLAEKMVQHYLEWVRTHYFISTNKLDKQFSNQLLLKSGLPVSVVNSMVEILREVTVERKPMTEADLYHLQQTIQQFYKNHAK